MGAFDFTGKRVLVTGASHGIGFAVASAFARDGADLAILSSTADIVDAGARIEAKCGRPVRAEICDITDREAVRRCVGGLGALDVLVKELGPKRIRVNAVCPGWVRTRAALRSLEQLSARAGVAEAAMLEDILAAQALPGLMTPDDVASAYLFLASDHAASVTGQAYQVDRGEVMA